MVKFHCSQLSFNEDLIQAKSGKFFPVSTVKFRDIIERFRGPNLCC